MQRIFPCLWFDTQAQEAAEYYTSIFKNSKINKVFYYGEESPMPKGTVMAVTFTIDGQDIMGLNGGPIYKLTEAVSLVVNCETQEEVDKYWAALTADGGKAIQCGWLTDKYGLTWQIVPTVLLKLISDADPDRAGRVMKSMMEMIKLDIEELERAYRGEWVV